MNDKNFLEWIYNRMVRVHDENPAYDYMNRFRKIIEEFDGGVNTEDFERVPYESSREIAQAQHEHGPSVRDIINETAYIVPTYFTENFVDLESYGRLSFKEFSNFRWQDGTPCCKTLKED